MDQKDILRNLQINALNEMQSSTLRVSQTKNNIVLISPTGSGKTLAFLIPIVQNLQPHIKGVQAIILVPSRELALQIESVFKKMGSIYKINACYGGHSTKTELNNFSTPPSVLVGTPGRIAFHIQNNSFSTDTISSYVIDEFDKALELGFHQDMEFIIGSLKHLKFKLLTSATELKKIPSFAQIESPEFIRFTQTKSIQPKITFKKVVSKPEEKLETVIKLIGKIGKDTILIFCNHREAVDRISETLIKKGVANSVFHGGLQQEEREKSLLRFKNKSRNILICTDLAARGLDIPEIGHVIHYQIPENQDTFIHRNGRTARMKASGVAYLIISEDQIPDFIDPNIPEETLNNSYKINNTTEFKTLYISAGKKDKINKVDLVGFLIKTGGIQKEHIGLIEVYDKQSYVAIKANKIGALIKNLAQQKIKNKKVKIEQAKD